MNKLYMTAGMSASDQPGRFSCSAVSARRTEHACDPDRYEHLTALCVLGARDARDERRAEAGDHVGNDGFIS
jgi:hypothetical protein